MTDTERLNWLEQMTKEHSMRIMYAGDKMWLFSGSRFEAFYVEAKGVDLRTAIDNAAHILKP